MERKHALHVVAFVAVAFATISPAASAAVSDETPELGLPGAPACDIGYGVPRVYVTCGLSLQQVVVNIDSGTLVQSGPTATAAGVEVAIVEYPECEFAYGVPRIIVECYYYSDPLIEVDTGA